MWTNVKRKKSVRRRNKKNKEHRNIASLSLQLRSYNERKMILKKLVALITVSNHKIGKSGFRQFYLIDILNHKSENESQKTHKFWKQCRNFKSETTRKMGDRKSSFLDFGIKEFQNTYRCFSLVEDILHQINSMTKFKIIRKIKKKSDSSS